MDEERCVDSCAGKLIRSNHRLMATYVQLMPRMVQRRMEEMESKAAENAKAEAAAASASVVPPVTESPQVTPLVPPTVTDIGASQSLVELNTAANQVELPVAPLTAETINSSNIADTGTSFTTGLPPTPTTGAQIESIRSEAASVKSVFTPPKATSLSEDVPVSTTSVPSMSKHPDNPSGPE